MEGADMAKKSQDMQRAIHHYRQVTGKTEVDMNEVAKFVVEKLGWQLPQPVDPMDRLARELARAAREETRTDSETGRPYRVNHAIPTTENGQTRFVWGDIDKLPRARAHKAFQHRREQMVGDATMLVYDADHWNSFNPREEPIQIELDFGMDVNLRKLASDDGDKKAG
jgi:hypothetical protein